MNRGPFFFLVLLLVAGGPVFSADSLQKARFTEVIRDVRVTKANSTDMREAKVNDSFEVPEVIRTGMDSRAELEAPDKTIARIGANTIFSFEAAKRTMNLQSGSVLFHSPKGMGGGTIKTAAATAAVTGTTLIVGATSSGGFKVMMLEGSGRVTHPSGDSKALKSGQLTFVIPGQQKLSPVINFDLQRATQASNLLLGFDKKISSQEKIDSETDKQQKSVKKGEVEETGQEIGELKENSSGKLVNTLSQIPRIFIQNNDFSNLKSFIVANSSANLIFSTSDLSTFNSYTSDSFVLGIYKGFVIASLAKMGAISGNNLTFNSANYDLTPFGSLRNFSFFADNNITINNSTTMNFQGTDIDRLNFYSTGGTLTFTGTNTINVDAKVLNFEAKNNITAVGAPLTFSNPSGNFDKILMVSKTGTISLSNPVFNAQVVELRGSRVDLLNFSISQYTGAKSMKVYTDTGNWYMGSTYTPTFAGSLNITDSSAGFDASGSAGSKVSTTTYPITNIQSLKN